MTMPQVFFRISPSADAGSLSGLAATRARFHISGKVTDTQ